MRQVHLASRGIVVLDTNLGVVRNPLQPLVQARVSREQVKLMEQQIAAYQTRLNRAGYSASLPSTN